MTSVICAPTLVLNKSWVAIATTTVGRALTMVYQGIARIIEPDTYQTYDFEEWADLAVIKDDQCVRTPNLIMRVPEVIHLVAYNKIPKCRIPFSRRNLYKRDKNTCQYCGGKPGTEELSIDHIIPRSKGGKSTWTNCVLACVPCNAKKSNRTPEQAGMKLLKKPKEPHWSITTAIGMKLTSLKHFVSDQYWNVELTD